MQFALWLAFSFAFSVFAIRFHRGALKFVILVALALPYVASNLVTGTPPGFFSIHPSSWLAIMAGGVALITRPREAVGLATRYPLPNFLLALVLATVAVTSLVRDGSSGLALVINQMAVPYIIYLWLQLEIGRDESYGPSLARFVVLLGALESMLSLLQWATKVTYFYAAEMSTYGWYRTNIRQLGTLDHPLTLSLLLAVCIPLTVNIRRATVQVPAVSLLLVGVLLTQSRTGLLLAVLGLAFLLLRKRAALRTRITAVAALGVGTILFFQSDLATGVALRLEDDNGSANARGLAIDFFLGNIGDYIFSGGGVGSSYESASKGGLATSLESPLFMYVLDFGLLITLTYFGVQICLALRWKRGYLSLPGARAAAIFAVLSTQTYSSVATESAASIIVWVAIGLVTPSLRRVEPLGTPAEAHLRENSRTPLSHR